jgi:CheY-like chemotaxis protein
MLHRLLASAHPHTKIAETLAKRAALAHHSSEGFLMGSFDPTNRGAVLVVDDDDDLRGLLRESLEYQHYLVFEASDGKGALDIMRLTGAPLVRLVILDLVMPGMTGWEFVEILRSDPKLSHIPVLVMSGVPVHGDASGIGATMSWLRKPFDEDALFAAVREAVGESVRRTDDSARSSVKAGRQSTPSHPGR